MMRALVIENEPKLATSLSEILKTEGFEVQLVNGRSYTCEIQDKGLNVLIVDLLAFGGNGAGISFVRSLRTKGCEVPVLLLTAARNTPERIAGLRAGADDCLAKPFDIGEFAARVEALARRRPETGSLLCRAGDLVIDPISRTATRGARQFELTRLEFRMLEHLTKHVSRICNRDEMLREVWGYDFDPGSNLVDVTVRRLRGKLDQQGETPMLHTIRGEGYVIRVPQQAAPRGAA